MGERVRAVRSSPDSGQTEVVLAADGTRRVLTMLRKGRGLTTRELAGPDLPSALSDAHELLSVDAVTRLEITCSDHDVRSLVVAALRDADPTASFAEEAWPEGTEGLPETDEWPIDEALRHRWITIDGDTYHLLPVDRTRAVHVEDGEIRSGDEVASVSWSFDGDVMSSTGSASLRVVGGDTLVRQDLGDDFPETTAVLFDGEVVSAIADWLDENGYAAAFLVETVQAPGLTAEERSALVEALWQSVSVYVEPDTVVERLWARGDRGRFRRALAEPGSVEGKRVYALLRDVAVGDEDVQTLLAELV